MRAPRKLIVSLVLAVVMVALALLQWHFALPEGRVGVIELGPALGLGAAFGLGRTNGTLTWVLGLGGMLLVGAGDWVNYGALLVAVILPLIAPLDRQPLNANRRRIRTFTAGLIYGAAMFAGTLVQGYFVAHTGAGVLAFGRQALAPSLLAGILIGYLTDVVVAFIQRWWPPVPPLTETTAAHRSVIIDLHQDQPGSDSGPDDDHHDDEN